MNEGDTIDPGGGRLRPRRERPSRNPANKRDEFASPHARPRSEGDILSAQMTIR
jgi:hypothetical protein